MTEPTINAYGRVTRNGIQKLATRTKGREMIRFNFSIFVESNEVTLADGRPVDDPEKRRRRPWWVTCIVMSRRPYQYAESLQAFDYCSVVGRLGRRRWIGDDGKERENWAIFVDNIAIMRPGFQMSMESEDDSPDPDNAEPPIAVDANIEPTDAAEDLDQAAEATPAAQEA